MPVPNSSLVKAGRFTDVRLIGRGAGGQVYYARDNLGRSVAVKEVLPSARHFQDLCDKLQKEAQILSLATGSYRVWFGPATSHAALYLGEYYDNAASLEEATPIDVVAGQITPGIDALIGKRQGGSVVYLPLLMR
jgi:serine/threonine protein kinase